MKKRFLFFALTAITSGVALAFLSILQNEVSEQIDIRGSALVVGFVVILLLVALNQWFAERVNTKFVGNDNRTTLYSSLLARELTSSQARDYQRILVIISRVKISIAGLQRYSLYKRARISLNVAIRYDLMRSSLSRRQFKATLDIRDSEFLRNPSDPILENNLILIGDPGTGKTLLMSEMVTASIEQLEASLRHGTQASSLSFPIILRMVSLKDGDFRKWLFDEIWINYRVPAREFGAWIAQYPFQLFLDGLDEVGSSNIGRVVASIKDFLHTYPLMSVVITCRTTEFIAILPQEEFGLYSVVEVQSLTSAQVDECVSLFGDSVRGLQQKLAGDSALQEMVNSPLMLWLMVETFSSEKTVRVSATRKGKAKFRETLIESFFRRRMQETTCSNHWGEATEGYIAFIATQLETRFIKVFDPRDIQPDWLQTITQKRIYVIALLLGLALPLAIVSAAGSVMIGTPVLGLVTLSVGGLPIGAAIALAIGSQTATKITSYFIGGVYIIAYFLAYQSIFSVYGLPYDENTLQLSLSATILISGFSALLYSLLLNWLLNDGEFNFSRRVGVKSWILYIIAVASLFLGKGISVVLALLLLADHLLSNKTAINTKIVETFNRVSWSWGRAASGALLGSVLGMLYAISTGAQFAQSVGINSPSSISLATLFELALQFGGASGLPVLAVCVALFSIVKGIEPQTEHATNARPPKRIHISVIGLVLGSLTTIVLFPIITTLRVIGMSLPTENPLFMGTMAGVNVENAIFEFSIWAGIWSGLAVGLSIAIAFGLLAGINQVLMKNLLVQAKLLPRKLNQFLGYASEELLLFQNLLGRYHFVHKAIQEHFANKDQLSANKNRTVK